ncbi:hypothetical protein BDV37DRAFT_280732 [Aspergillus pseudonomiae]|uniref:Polyketide synthase n=1 Tax=Aspergillus pseudonomiae TaxID=1506151 RepID=A0A5N7DJZ3_9EURO|nr:uncharacterized protein BDV37DRAFT_280732 [Aspergillus pseudonomiae]KAE8406449.1 hypothetical protein BDV37DRAFT_280732 [Aspergillus pseudonomiae]
MAMTPQTSDSSLSGGPIRSMQEPIAVVSMACRLPGHSDSPQKLWEFLVQGGVADTKVPETRFNLDAFYDGSDRPKTMRSPGAMFMETVDPAKFDASFFNISAQEATAMDPQQRIILEVIYEALENAGLTLESLAGQRYGCFVGGHPGDYWDVFARDPDSRPVNAGIGGSGTMLSNRVSHFLGITGPSMSLDTACSSSLVALDMACKFLQTGEIDGAVIAASNLVLHPEYGCDTGPIRNTHSPTGRCHTFDAKADGYIKAEGINAVILKRLDDAVQAGDPIRAVIRGTANNHSGRTPGIASPSADAQAAAVRTAYKNANITDFSLTSYLECHGTGTLAGDPVEVAGVSSVFAESRAHDRPLHIGSIKSNIGHSETAAGLSGLIKAIMILETGLIPGNPTFETPNPNIDFSGLKVKVSRSAIPFPKDVPFRRVGVNNFGFGGSNSHAILEEPRVVQLDYCPTHKTSYTPPSLDCAVIEAAAQQPYILCFSANNQSSLKRYIEEFSQHCASPSVHLNVRDVAYTLGVRRSQHFHRGYLITDNLTHIDPTRVVYGKKSVNAVNVGFVFTGQGAQWPQMGLELLASFPVARRCVEKLDKVLHRLPNRPTWSLYDELTRPCSPEHIRNPELSQPLVTALQIAMVELFRSWGISPTSVLGHSSGEIAAAYAAGYLTDAEAIVVAYHRGMASQTGQPNDTLPLGMLAVGLGAEQVSPYLDGLEGVQIACYNSPASVTLSGLSSVLEQVKVRLTEGGVFARMLQVDLAYHSTYMETIGDMYEHLLNRDLPSIAQESPRSSDVTMFSSVTGSQQEVCPGIKYWKRNMTSPVRFEDAARAMLGGKSSATLLVEIGPHGALKGPITQIQRALEGTAAKIPYLSALNRGSDSIHHTLAVAGQLFLAGAPIDLEKVLADSKETRPMVIVDLPNYCWDHSTPYWFETQASKDWRFRPFVHHDLLGSKILGTSWLHPTFKKTMDLSLLPWLKDHRIGTDVVFPASGYIAMAVEAMYQTGCMRKPNDPFPLSNELSYQLRNVRFNAALVLEEEVESEIYLTMSPFPGSNENWFEFLISSRRDGTITKHAAGLIRLQEPVLDPADEKDIAPFEHASPGHLWTKACAELGYHYGPAFHLLEKVESRFGQRRARSLITLADPPSAHDPQSLYPVHPAALDGVFRAVVPAAIAGDRSRMAETLIPAMVDDFIINPTHRPDAGIAVASSYYSGRGREDTEKSYLGNTSVYDPTSGALLIRMTGLSSHRIDLGIDPVNRHTLTQDVLKADISTLNEKAIQELGRGHTNLTPVLLDLMMHKKPSLNVLEIDLGTREPRSVWLQSLETGAELQYQYRYLARDATNLSGVESKYRDQANTSFQLLDLESSHLGVENQESFDLIILKAVSPLPPRSVAVVGALKDLLALDGHILATDYAETSLNPESESSLVHVVENVTFAKVLSIPSEPWATFLCRPRVLADRASAVAKQLHIIYMEENTILPRIVEQYLTAAGWQVTEHQYMTANVPAGAPVLILDELYSPLLVHINEAQWLCLRHLITSGCKLIWVTRGGQLSASEPGSALAAGLFRSIRSEDPAATLMTLDMQSQDASAALAAALPLVLEQLQMRQADLVSDSEYVEKDGILHIHRVVPYHPLNHEIKLWKEEFVHTSLSTDGPITRLVAEELGTLEGLRFVQTPDEILPDNHVEIEIHAAGLNFKDVAVTMGIVPENERLLGLEGSGIIRRVGSNIDDKTIIGTPVVFMEKGAFANRIQVPIDFTHRIPNTMSFSEAATIPVAFCTALYSLFDMADLQPGQSVLIHSASGGVGIACIQLAQYVGAEIYVTVGSDAKRRFLHDTYKIPYERMFSSRCSKFAAGIMKATDGKGIDVIVNSITGDLLDATWRVCAAGGTLVELGKRDMVERNTLSMEPFDRGCSFRAVDLSHPRLLRKLPSILRRVFDLASKGHIHPINPMTTFPITQAAEAFSYMRSGKHIGKVVIDGMAAAEGMSAPVRPLRQDITFNTGSAYLIVGGLKGLCGSLALHLAQRGARHLVVMSRSGCADSRSQAVISNCHALGCNVYDCRGDVSRICDVRQAFLQAPVPIKGVVQGVMLLRDRPYELMTINEFHESIEGKVQGTWNLHNVSIEIGRELDFFLLLSSISSVVGSPGQANYAAANSFLDSFASYRRSMGLAAQTINLGVIEDVGVVAESEDLSRRHEASKELIGIPERVLHCMVDTSLRQQFLQHTHQPNSGGSEFPTRLITGLTVPQDPAQSGLRFDPRFRGLFVGNSNSQANAGKPTDELGAALQSFHAMIRAGAAADELHEPCLSILATRLARMLRYNENQQIEPGQPLSVYGLDSLSMVELRNWIKAQMGAEVTTFDVLNANSLIMLAQRVVNKLRRE